MRVCLIALSNCRSCPLRPARARALTWTLPSTLSAQWRFAICLDLHAAFIHKLLGFFVCHSQKKGGRFLLILIWLDSGIRVRCPYMYIHIHYPHTRTHTHTPSTKGFWKQRTWSIPNLTITQKAPAQTRKEGLGVRRRPGSMQVAVFSVIASVLCVPFRFRFRFRFHCRFRFNPTLFVGFASQPFVSVYDLLRQLLFASAVQYGEMP